MSTATAVRDPKVQDPVLPETGVQDPVKIWRPQPLPPAAPPVAVERLFESVLLESSGVQRRRRTLSAALSFVFQCLMLGVVVLVPLWFTDALPKQQLLTFLVAPPPPPPPAAPESATRAMQRVKSEMMLGSLRTPSKIPERVQIIREEEEPVLAPGGVVGGIPGGIPGGQLGGVIGGILSSASSLTPAPKLMAAVPKRIRISQGVTRGQVLDKVEAKYPPLALIARIQGDVVLKAIISKAGNIQNLELVSGHPMLVPAALKAVQQWRYRPFLLNGEPVEVETTVTVKFHIG